MECYPHGSQNLWRFVSVFPWISFKKQVCYVAAAPFSWPYPQNLWECWQNLGSLGSSVGKHGGASGCDGKNALFCGANPPSQLPPLMGQEDPLEAPQGVPSQSADPPKGCRSTLWEPGSQKQTQALRPGWTGCLSLLGLQPDRQCSGLHEG